MDGNGLEFEKIGHFCQVLMPHVKKILKKFIIVSPLIKFICYLRRSFTEAFCL